MVVASGGKIDFEKLNATGFGSEDSVINVSVLSRYHVGSIMYLLHFS